MHARAAEDEDLVRLLRYWALLTLLAGPAPVDEAMPAALELVAGATSVVGRGGAKQCYGLLLAMSGDTDAAREQVRSGREHIREAGQLVEAAGAGMRASFVEVRAGALQAAEDALRNCVEELDRLGNRGYRGTAALLLADLLASRGAHEEAARWCSEVRGTLNESDLMDVISTDSLGGFLAAIDGAQAEAERLSDRAIGLASTIDMYDPKARAYEWHARTLALCGKPAEAREAAATALAIYEAKGDVPASAWTRELLDSLSA